jgi:endo-1,4-beta-xylanase
MNNIIKLAGVLAVIPAMFLGSCKKGPEVGMQNLGNFSETGTALKDVASFPIGVAVNFGPLTTEPKFAEATKRDFDAVTFGYEMKHGAIVQANGTYNFAQADAMVAALGSMDIFGHTLLWHQNQNATYLKNYAGITVPASTELATNPGFENGLNNWSIFNTGNPAGSATIAATTVATEIRSGTTAMKVVNPTAYTNSQWRVQVSSGAINTTPGTQYTISYWVKAAAPNGSIRLSSGPTNQQYQADQTIGTAWQQVSWTITANIASTTFLFDMGQVANTYFIDDVSIKEVVAAPSGAQIAVKLETALSGWINALVGKYKGKVKAWDVVNEPFSDNPVAIRNNTNTSTTPADVLVWSNYLGRDFALKAFNYAKAADPAADLYINDYNLESIPAKLDSLITFVAELKTKGAKVDGIGTQMHITRTTSYDGIDVMMKKLGATGLKIRISELDVRTILGNVSGKATPELLAYQAVMYKYVVSSYMKYIPKAQQAGITIWGVNDRNSWLYSNGAEAPLLYDNDYNKKPAYAAVLQGLQGQ